MAVSTEGALGHHSVHLIERKGRVLVHQVVRVSGLPFRDCYTLKEQLESDKEDIHQTSLIGEAALHSSCTVFPLY